MVQHSTGGDLGTEISRVLSILQTMDSIHWRLGYSISIFTVTGNVLLQKCLPPSISKT